MASTQQPPTTPNSTQHDTQQRRAALPNSPPGPPRGEKIEGLVQTLIMLAIGTAAGAASFRHVHDVASAHGQPGWLAWADALTLEATSIAAGLELRRRKRVGKPVLFPAATLTVAVALSLSAQVVEAEPSIIGWIAAALPALGFLAMVKMAMGRADPAPFAHTHPSPGHIRSGPGHIRSGPGHIRSGPGPVRDAGDRTRPDQTDPDGGPDLGGLVPAARTAARSLATQQVTLTRASLAKQLRQDGHPLSTETASALVRILRAEPLNADPV